MKSLGVSYRYVKITQMRVDGAWIRMYYVLCSKTYGTFSCLFWSPVGSRRAARGTAICEICL